MSIIHEALKKAEREREPRPTGLPFYGGVRTARRRWYPDPATSLLIGLTTVGAVTLFLCFYAYWGSDPSGSTVGPTVRDLPALVLEGEDQTVLPTLIAHSPASQLPIAGTQPPPADDVPSPSTPPTLTMETQVAAQAMFDRARAAEFKEQWEEAIGYYRQALTLNPTLVEARNNLGALYVRQRQLTAAIDEFRAAIRLDSSYATVHNNLGSAYMLSGQETLAIQEFLAALYIDGTYVSPLYNLASLYARRGDIGQTVAFLTRALALEPAVLSWLQEDPDFDGIKATPDVQRLYTQGQTRR